MRFYQFLPYLASAGIRVQVEPLFGSYYIHYLFTTGRRPILNVLHRYARRIHKLTKVNGIDLLWIEKELFPWLIGMDELFLRKFQIPIVVDYDDAVFHSYDSHPHPMVRVGLGDKIGKIMRKASVITAGNDYLVTYAASMGAKCIEKIPTVVDMSRYQFRPKSNGKFTVGWIGSPITEKYLKIIRSVLEVMSLEGNFRLVLVGATPSALHGLNPEIIEWHEASEVQSIQEFDVGVMPLIDDAFERGKCGYKIIQCMACGVPVIASPVGVNKIIVDHGTNGFLAQTDQEWLTHLRMLRDDKERRQVMGLRARNKMSQDYSLAQIGPKLARILMNAAR